MKTKFLSGLIFLTFLTISALSHGTERHEDKEKISKKELQTVIPENINKKEQYLKNKYMKINDNYTKNIKPIFEAKCFNCHSNATNYPFYYKIPGIKTMIDEDIKEAKKHIDFTDDFPFISHETPINDLKSLKKIALEGGMPPLKYILVHWDSKLNEDDKKAILKWTTNSIDILKNN